MATTRRIGISMIVLTWGLLILLLSYSFFILSEHQYNPNKNPNSGTNASGAQEVTLQRNRQGQFISSGQINGQPVVFLVDTGASHVVVPSKLADELNLQPEHPFAVVTANGTVTVYSTHLQQVGLGGIELTGDIRASINPHMEGDLVLLGTSFLRHLEFEQKDDKLILRLPT